MMQNSQTFLTDEKPENTALYRLFPLFTWKFDHIFLDRTVIGIDYDGVNFSINFF
jgi:hypothetical protein